MTMTGIERVGSIADVGVEDIAQVAAGLDDGARQAAIEVMSLPTNHTHELSTAVEPLACDRRAVRPAVVDESRGPDRLGTTW